MPILQVRVEGISLWIERESFWEVLFPVTYKKIDLDKWQHVPKLTILSDGESVGKPVSLEDHTLDLSHLHGVSAVSSRPNWMIKLNPSPASGVRKRNASALPLVFASAYLPKYPLNAISDRLVGPVTYGGNDDIYIDYGTLLQGESLAPIMPIIRDRRTGREILPRPNIPVNSRIVTVLLHNKTEAEHKSKSRDGIGQNKPLDEVSDVLDLCGLPPGTPPVYKGPARKPLPPAVRATLPPTADEFKPCPHCLVDPIDDDASL